MLDRYWEDSPVFELPNDANAPRGAKGNHLVGEVRLPWLVRGPSEGRPDRSALGRTVAQFPGDREESRDVRRRSLGSHANAVVAGAMSETGTKTIPGRLNPCSAQDAARPTTSRPPRAGRTCRLTLVRWPRLGGELRCSIASQ